MSIPKLIKFPGGSQDKGLNNFEPAIDAEISWANDTVNVTGGMRRGVGPRYGVAPLAGHSNTEAPAGTACNGLMKSEATSGGQGLVQRKTIYAVIPITMAPLPGAYPKTTHQYYVYLVGLTNSSTVTLDACVGAIFDTPFYEQAATLVAGLTASSYREQSPLLRQHKTELLNLPLTGTPTAADMQSILDQSAPVPYWLSSAHITVSGKRVPYQWMLAGNTGSTPDATTAPDLNLWSRAFSIGTTPTVLGGSPSEIITREFTSNIQRGLTVYCLDDDGYNLDMVYTKQITQANTFSVPAYAPAPAANYANLTGCVKIGASTAYGSVSAALINDPGSFTNSRHDAILMAGATPLAAIYQDWLVQTNGMMPRWVDLTTVGCTPRAGLSVGQIDSQQIFTTSFAQLGEDTLKLGDTDSGVLRDGTTYDFGFSYYNKLIDFETNVAFGATKDVVGAAGEDFFSIFVDFSSTATDSVWKNFQTSQHWMPWEYSDSTARSSKETGRGEHLNDYELRFYFRETGTEEWLPAGKYDAAQYWFYGLWAPSSSKHGPILCTGPSGALPGGQPNGFVDYSPLPKQRYICTTVFQQRAFWWSEKSMHFSYSNNIYAYPTRNITAAPTGKWRGGIVHQRTSLSQQTSRLLVFGDVAYSARFTGVRTIQNVRISTTTVGQFEVDGSDFVMDYLCEGTAFSFRAAVVAEGVAYWWGPQGVYRDDGVTEAKKISWTLDPEIQSFIDSSRDSEVHCVYNKRSREIVWFYPPKVADTSFPTYGLVYNIDNEQFYPYKFRCQVDASQNLKVENDSTPANVAGERLLLHCRETTSSTVSRSYFFDEVVQAGEQGPARELTILTVATPSAGTRRLTFATGSIGVTAGGIAANDLVCIQNAKGYAPALTLADDMIAKVTAVNNASSYIDILLPTDAAFDASASLTGQTAFPIYQKKPAAAGLHGIIATLQTNYWLPNGVSESYYWQYLYFLFRYVGIPTPIDPFTGLPIGAPVDLSYRSLVCRAALTDTLKIRDNSVGHCQIHHPLRGEGRAASGQALAYGLSAIHIGNPWTLQYLEAHCSLETGFTLKEFEG